METWHGHAPEASNLYKQLLAAQSGRISFFSDCGGAVVHSPYGRPHVINRPRIYQYFSANICRGFCTLMPFWSVSTGYPMGLTVSRNSWWKSQKHKIFRALNRDKSIHACPRCLADWLSLIYLFIYYAIWQHSTYT